MRKISMVLIALMLVCVGFLSGCTTNQTGIEGNTTTLYALCFAHPDNGNAPLTVEFDGTSSYASDGIKTYYWDFGDGQTGTGSKPSHIFQNIGTYSVILTITDNEDYIATDTVTITVSEPVVTLKIIRYENEDSIRFRDEWGNTKTRYGAFFTVTVKLTNSDRSTKEISTSSYYYTLYTENYVYNPDFQTTDIPEEIRPGGYYQYDITFELKDSYDIPDKLVYEYQGMTAEAYFP